MTIVHLLPWIPNCHIPRISISTIYAYMLRGDRRLALRALLTHMLMHRAA